MQIDLEYSLQVFLDHSDNTGLVYPEGTIVPKEHNTDKWDACLFLLNWLECLGQYFSFDVDSLDRYRFFPEPGKQFIPAINA